MFVRYDAAINGVPLSGVSDKIYISNISESAPKIGITTIDNAKYGGKRMTERTRDSLTVTVTLSVRERNSAERAAIIDAIMAWIADGELTVNYRPDQMLAVEWTDLPAVGSALEWAGNMTIDFTAYTCPYWQSVHYTIASGDCVAATPKTLTLTPVGTYLHPLLEFEMTANASIATLTIVANGYAWAFASLGIVSGDVLRGYYDAKGYLHFEKNGTSVYANRSGDDDIILGAMAANTVTVTASGAANFRAKVRGRFL